jgi:hypothetical protein
MRSAALPLACKQQLSTAVQELLQALFIAVGVQTDALGSAWVKSGANLLLRALTRSPQFVRDPELPLLPDSAVAALRWLRHASLMRQGGAGSSGGGAAAAGALGDSSGSGGGGAASGMMLIARDDKVYLLITKLVLTATGTPCAVAAAVSNASTVAGMAAARAASLGGSDAATHASPAPAAAADSGDSGDSSSNVRWAGAAAANAGGAAGFQGVRDPALICQLLEWSSSKVRLAMQQLLEPTGVCVCG